MKLTRYTSPAFVGYVDPRYDGDGLRALLIDPTRVGEMVGAESIPTRPGREVYRVTIEGARGSFDVYTHLLVNTRFVETLRRPQAYTVLRTGQRMLQAGLPTSRVLAAVWPRRMPLNRSSFAVTLAIKDATPLSALEPEEFGGRVGGFKKTALIRQVASSTAWLHLHGFYHRDLIAPNILIGRRASTPVVWFVGLGRAGRSVWLPPYLRQIRWAADLRALVNSDVQAFTERDRALFLEMYLRALGNPPGSRLIRKILEREGSGEL